MSKLAVLAAFPLLHLLRFTLEAVCANVGGYSFATQHTNMPDLLVNMLLHVRVPIAPMAPIALVGLDMCCSE